MDVPFVDLRPMHEAMRNDLDRAFARVLDRSYYILGPEAKSFDLEFAEFQKAKHAVGVGNGLDALHLVLRALEIGPGDEVIAPTHTFVATVSAIALAGARPILVDCDRDTLSIDVSAVRAALTPRTKAIIPVHLYGRVANMEELLPLAERHKVVVMEDAAQAHGALWQGKKAGSLADVGCFSFYPTKNLGALGDGGAVVTNDARLAEKVRLVRNYGTREKYEHEIVGFNSRLDDLQAALLREKLRRLDAWTADRHRAARFYRTELKGLVEIPALPREGTDDADHVYHLFVIRVPDRDRVRAKLAERGIKTEVHYPVPIHLQPAFESFGLQEGSFPVAEAAAKELISLPLFVGITAEQQGYVVDALRDILG